MSKKKSGGENDVGYGKPPKNNQFKPGQSGNPKGRPKKTISVQVPSSANLRATIIETMLHPVEYKENGARQKIPMIKAILLSQANVALSGSVYAARFLLTLTKTAIAENDEAQLRFMEMLLEKEDALTKAANKGKLEERGLSTESMRDPKYWEKRLAEVRAKKESSNQSSPSSGNDNNDD